ncbi:MAG: hypothetical protein ACRC7O_00965 [Fimbriiglobus sp.]
MSEIVLTPEQWAPVAAARRIEVKDPAGRVLGWLDPAAAEAVAESVRRRANPGPCFTSEQVRRQLASLEAERIQRGGTLPPERLAELVAGFDVTDPAAGSIRTVCAPR